MDITDTLYPKLQLRDRSSCRTQQIYQADSHLLIGMQAG